MDVWRRDPAGVPPHTTRRGIAVALLLCALVCCDRDAPRRFLERRAVLKRQIDELNRLVSATEKGGFLPKDKLVVAISEHMADELMQLALPREQVIASRYRVRLEKASVHFRAEQGSVRFEGKVGPPEGGAFFADLVLFGVVDAVGVDRDSGILHCNVAVVGFEIQRFDTYGETEVGRLLLTQLGQQSADVLKTLAFPIAIPVRLEHELALKGVSGEGPVQLQPASLPLQLTVTSTAAHAGRLWVAVDVAAKRGPR